MLVGLGNFFFRYRNLLVPLAFALVLLPGPRIFGDPYLPLIAGAGIALLGQIVRALTIGLKYIVRGGRNRRVYAEDLVTDGIYSHTRNPMYVGNLLILAGLAVASNSWIVVLVAIPLAVLVYVSIVAAEENFLRGKFGPGYDEYARAVPRWLIKFRGLGETLGSSEFHWRRLLVKEYGTTAAWIVAISVTAWISFRYSTGAAPTGALRTTLFVCVAIVAVFWLAARWLKKSRTVVAD